MSLQIKQRQSGTVTILELSGRLTMGPGLDTLHEALESLILGGRRSVLLDCSEVSLIDSQGIKALVRGLTAVERQGGRLKLLKMTPRVREVLGITRLLTVIEAFDDESTALRSFEGPGIKPAS
jgi:anti-sigma B factor antagonist